MAETPRARCRRTPFADQKSWGQIPVVLGPDTADLLDLVDGQLAGAPLFVDQLALDFHWFTRAETGQPSWMAKDDPAAQGIYRTSGRDIPKPPTPLPGRITQYPPQPLILRIKSVGVGRGRTRWRCSGSSDPGRNRTGRRCCPRTGQGRRTGHPAAPGTGICRRLPSRSSTCRKTG